MFRQSMIVVESFITIAPICGIAALARDANAQEIPSVPASADWGGTGGEETASLRREVDELTQLIRTQQRQIEQQARQLQQVQGVLASERSAQPPTSVRGIPAYYSGTDAISSSVSESQLLQYEAGLPLAHARSGVKYTPSALLNFPLD